RQAADSLRSEIELGRAVADPRHSDGGMDPVGLGHEALLSRCARWAASASCGVGGPVEVSPAGWGVSTTGAAAGLRRRPRGPSTRLRFSTCDTAAVMRGLRPRALRIEYV